MLTKTVNNFRTILIIASLRKNKWSFARQLSYFIPENVTPKPSIFSVQKFHPFVIPLRLLSNKVPAKKTKGKKAKVDISPDEMKKVINFDDMVSDMDNALELLKQDFAKHLSLRSAIGSIEALQIEFESEVYPLHQLGQVIRKSPQLVLINMANFPQALQAVIKAITTSGMNLSPQQEGTSIFVPIPKMTREHRENLSKGAKEIFNRTKERLRNIQNSYVKDTRAHKGALSEDLIFNVQQKILSTTEEYSVKAEALTKAKQTELLGDNQ